MNGWLFKAAYRWWSCWCNSFILHAIVSPNILHYNIQELECGGNDCIDHRMSHIYFFIIFCLHDLTTTQKSGTHFSPYVCNLFHTKRQKTVIEQVFRAVIFVHLFLDFSFYPYLKSACPLFCEKWFREPLTDCHSIKLSEKKKKKKK